jgi:hypothetical protein
MPNAYHLCECVGLCSLAPRGRGVAICAVNDCAVSEQFLRRWLPRCRSLREMIFVDLANCGRTDQHRFGTNHLATILFTPTVNKLQPFMTALSCLAPLIECRMLRTLIFSESWASVVAGTEVFMSVFRGSNATLRTLRVLGCNQPIMGMQTQALWSQLQGLGELRDLAIGFCFAPGMDLSSCKDIIHGTPFLERLTLRGFGPGSTPADLIEILRLRSSRLKVIWV